VALWTVPVICLAWAVVRVDGLDRGWPLVQLIAFTPYVAGAAAVAVVVAAVARHWPAAAVAAVAGVMLVACVLPRGFGTPDRTAGVELRVLAANLYAGEADAAAVVDLVRTRRVDVLALQELTPPAQAALEAAGLAALLPHSALSATDSVVGSGIYSLYPLRDATVRINPGGFTQVAALVEVMGATAVSLHSVHPVAPATWDSIPYWRNGLRGQVPADPASPPRILAGDFNATVDHVDLRRLLDTGYTDAAGEVGAGFTTTWPYHGPRSWLTPKVTIDHVLVDRRIGVRDFAAFRVPGTDHRAILATLVLPPG
jgi:endonuclease/exonuclease/phosphatase family metal-dependent hydrolase